MPRITPLGYFGRFVGLIFVGAFIVLIISLLFSPSQPEYSASEQRKLQFEADRFIFAKVGEHWIIRNGDILFFPSPTIDLQKKLGRIPLDSIVEILNSRGDTHNVLERSHVWKKVAVLDSQFKTTVTGWVQANWVTRSESMSSSIPN